MDMKVHINSFSPLWGIMDLNHIAIVLRHCGRVQALNHGRRLHSDLIKTGVLNNVFLANNLISMYVEFCHLKYAHKVFDEMLERNVVSWTTMVSAYTGSGKPQEAIGIYNQMLEFGSEEPNGFMYSAALKACGLAGDLELGKLIHKRVSGGEFQFDIVLMNTLLDMYVRCGSLSDARSVFDEILCKNAITWNTIISGYCKEGLMEEAVDLFHQIPEPNVVSWNSIIAGFADNGSHLALDFVYMMHQDGLKLDGFTLPCALKSCCSHGFIASGKQIHSYVVRSGYESDYFSVSALVDMYSNFNLLNDARKLFDLYSGCNASACDSLALWNSMLSGYVVNEQYGAALKLVSQIHQLAVYFDCYTFGSALKVCIHLCNLRLGRQVHGLIVTNGYGLDNVVGSILIDLYAKHGNIRDALGLFHRLRKKDIVVWSGLVAGCARMGLGSLAFSLFKDMVNLGLDVDQFVVSNVLKVCSSLASIRSGKQTHAFCIKSGYDTEEVTVTALIDMYSKCGDIEDGLALFDSMPKKDTVCWTGIIVGCGHNGRSMEAIKIFCKMVELGLKPNEITFTGVLSACRHAGFVEEARTIFQSMKTEYGVEPQLEHYHCIIDLLGQAGYFKEAEKLIADMPFEPNKAIWCSLLRACGIHRNMELVNIITQHLLASSPEDPSVYVTLSNVYATYGLWDSLSKAREAVEEVGKREAGKSWIEIPG
ncbi:pentatricopeptide repeat-containing protein At4g08210 [Carya illinoinensis]|uniref:Pentatricopeptide repeat-containing protein n=2 Tax=Carya illinoinensis TaxID=32201 RepID=A0A922F5T5_CARIL|nr:pentatricopeptide repeat-containing protein At4g08210 [Carya illinoinensis]XP_042978031.1 pentatricopeptide repeat-containing protein At4g08210 [Carya illinoinensis]XP_042978032.1 pentatricopeptide repeat-containing protein At4g08210 [Carya illinoinensis]XP_042978033.1 pentatricopeptide repeat-containing protein At4g08210 [Carya illinoinensis]XP_042978034.1 pentatricopeptide repeat-containing protein At4g08210 [Carya illinoinensis]XP_042978036.1 pentatricopeptide repeat-containing protein A